jgi:hypothetical protein
MTAVGMSSTQNNRRLTLDAIRILSSKLYRFSIGPQKREYTIHSAVVEIQSPTLNTLVNNTNFKEGCDCHAELEDVDEETFISFVEYAYTRSYGEMHTVAPAPVATQAEIPEPPAAKPKKNGLKRSKLWVSFTAAVADARPPDYDDSRTSTVNILAEDKGIDLLLRHARLYLFADCYGISRLMGLSLYNLGTTLIIFGSQENRGDRMEDIVTLLRYCYDRPTPEQLRSLLLLRAVCDVEKLWKRDSFRELLAAHRELAVDLVGIMIRRLD